MRNVRSLLATVVTGVKGLFCWPAFDPAIVTALERAHAAEYVISWAYAFDGDDARLWAECPRADRLLLIAAAAGVDRHLISSALHAAVTRGRLDGEAAADGGDRAWARDLEAAREAVLLWVEGRGRLEAALTLLRDALEDVAPRRAAAIAAGQPGEAEALDEALQDAQTGDARVPVPVLGAALQRVVIAERLAKAKIEALHARYADAVRATIAWTVVDDALHRRYEGTRGPYR